MTERKCYLPSKLDFEVGYLVKSPCKECWAHHRFPVCLQTCELLDQVQSLLARTVLTTRSFSSKESFAIHLESRSKK